MWLAIVSGGVFVAFHALNLMDSAADVPTVRRIGCWIALGLCVVALLWSEAFAVGMGRWVDAVSDRTTEWFRSSLEDLQPRPATTTPDVRECVHVGRRLERSLTLLTAAADEVT